MGLTDRDKKRRDRNRYEKYGGVNLIKTMLLRCSSDKKVVDGYRMRKRAKSVAREAMGKGADHRKVLFLAETILRYSVGDGYLRQVEGGYLITRKGAELAGFKEMWRENTVGSKEAGSDSRTDEPELYAEISHVCTRI
ncbi:MAG: hypothetical protein QXW77_04400 [Candidatus Hadarchaeales archaeon]